MSIRELKYLDLSSLKSVPDELSKSPIWEVLEFKPHEDFSYYKLKGKSHKYYEQMKCHCKHSSTENLPEGRQNCWESMSYHCELIIFKDRDPKIVTFVKQTDQ